MNRFAFRTGRCALAIAALGLAAAAHAATTNLVKNGSFELPAYTDDGLYGGGGDDWTGSFLGPRLVHGNADDQNGVPYGTTSFGSQYLVLSGVTHGGAASDAQLVDGFVAGQKYTFTMYAADLDGNTNPQLDITFDDGAGTTYADKTVKLPVGGPYKKKAIKFRKLSATFTSPVTGAIRLTIGNPFFADDGLGLVAVDNVSIVPAAAEAVVDLAMGVAPAAGR